MTQTSSLTSFSEAPGWPQQQRYAVRQERHFDGREVFCFSPRAASVYSIFAAGAARNPQAEALVADGRRLSYAQLAAEAERIAAGLHALGIRPGQRVAMLLANRLEFVTVYLGIQRLGAVAVPMDVRLKRPEIAHVLNQSGSSAIFHEADLAAEVPVDELAQPVARIAISDAEGLQWPSGAQISAVPPLPDLQEEALATLLYTSGTTGLPKGAMLTHLNFAHSVIHFELSLELGENERTLLVVPASHVTGLLAILTFLWMGGAVVMMRAFKAPAFLQHAADEKISHTVMVPAMYNLCLLQPDFSQYDLRHWRLGHFGGSPMPVATIRSLGERLPWLRLVDGYGATECCSPVALTPPNLRGEKGGAIGMPLHCAEIRVIGPDGKDQPPGQQGEIWIRGPMVVPGYYNNPQATADNFTDGYWHSGDVGSLSAEGLFSVFDRLKDVINRGGYKIYSVEVENTLNHHPDVLESAVVAKACPVLGERVHAFISAKRPGLAAESLSAYCAERLADYKRPESYTILEQPLPRNSGGKVLKRDLRVLLQQDQA